MNTKKRGQYWTPDEGEGLAQGWNANGVLPYMHWSSEHRAYLEQCNLVDSSDVAHMYIRVEGYGEWPVVTVLYVAEMMQDAVPYSAIYKRNHEKDPRYCERLVPAFIRRLALPLTFKVVECDEEGFRIVANTELP